MTSATYYSWKYDKTLAVTDMWGNRSASRYGTHFLNKISPADESAPSSVGIVATFPAINVVEA